MIEFFLAFERPQSNPSFVRNSVRPWKLDCKNVFIETADTFRECKPVFDNIRCKLYFYNKRKYKLVFLNSRKYHFPFLPLTLKLSYYAVTNTLNFEKTFQKHFILKIFMFFLGCSRKKWQKKTQRRGNAAKKVMSLTQNFSVSIFSPNKFLQKKIKK